MHILSYIYWGFAGLIILGTGAMSGTSLPTAMGAMTGAFIIFFIPWYLVSWVVGKMTLSTDTQLPDPEEEGDHAP